jgi:hypothetical protein
MAKYASKVKLITGALVEQLEARLKAAQQREMEKSLEELCISIRVHKQEIESLHLHRLQTMKDLEKVCS